MGWQSEFQQKLVSAEYAVSHVQSGSQVVMPVGRDPLALGLALAARKEELNGVRIFARTPSRDFGWYDPGWNDSFDVTVSIPLPVCVEALADHRVDLSVNTMDFAGEYGWLETDVAMVEVSLPDKHGFCSFGVSLWDKRELCEEARLVLAEVNEHLIRTCGENYVHVSEVDYFVEHPKTGREHSSHDLLGRHVGNVEMPAYLREIAKQVNGLIRDGDTIQIGAGSTTEPLIIAGAFADKNDLGWHSEATPRGAIDLVRRGVMTGRRKTVQRNIFVCTAIGGGTPDEIDYIVENPRFELHRGSHVNNITVIARQDNMVAINNALSVDLTGQIAAEQIGRLTYSVAGGQTAFAIGAMLAKGGRAITVLPSTAKGGTTSRIVPELEKGTVVTVPRLAADYIVTEYGVASLRYKTRRQRAKAMIEIAHPDFRDWLRQEARELYWPKQ